MSLPKTIRWLLFGTTGLIGLILAITHYRLLFQNTY